MTSEADLAAHLVGALTQAAVREGAATLISVNIEMIAAPADGETRVDVSRKTRTLLFLQAHHVAADGTRIAIATSVHAVKD